MRNRQRERQRDSSIRRNENSLKFHDIKILDVISVERENYFSPDLIRVVIGVFFCFESRLIALGTSFIFNRY